MLMRNSYWTILRVLLQSCPAAVVIGDPGIGKSSLLRVFFGMCVHKWSDSLREAAKLHNVERQHQWTGVFWIMESGQYIYAEKRDTAGNDGEMKQVVGIYGRGQDEEEDRWHEKDVLLLVDGAVPPPMLAKISNVFVFASPQPANYHRMMKKTNDVQLILSPWSTGEVQTLMNNMGNALREHMQPYLTYIRSTLDTDLPGESLQQASADQLSCYQLDDELDSDRDSVAKSESHDMSSDHPDEKETPGPGVSLSPGDPSAEDGWNAQPQSFRWTKRLFEYDEADALACLLDHSATTSKHQVELEFLKDHILQRYRLVGGRIHLLLNPSVTFAMLKQQVLSVINSVSVDQLREESWIDSHRYVCTRCHQWRRARMKCQRHRLRQTRLDIWF